MRNIFPGFRQWNRNGRGILRRISVGVLLLACAAPFTACINSEAETLYEDVEVTRKDELSPDTTNRN